MYEGGLSALLWDSHCLTINSTMKHKLWEHGSFQSRNYIIAVPPADGYHIPGSFWPSISDPSQAQKRDIHHVYWHSADSKGQMASLLHLFSKYYWLMLGVVLGTQLHFDGVETITSGKDWLNAMIHSAVFPKFSVIFVKLVERYS